MGMDLDQDEKTFAKVLSVKQAAAQAILMATVRVNQGELRGGGTDRLGKLLDQLRSEAA